MLTKCLVDKIVQTLELKYFKEYHIPNINIYSSTGGTIAGNNITSNIKNSITSKIFPIDFEEIIYIHIA